MSNFSLTRGVGENLSAPLSWDRLIQLLQYGKRMKGIRIEEKTNLKGNQTYTFFSRKGMLKISMVNKTLIGSIFMSGQSEADLEQDSLLKLFYSAIFCLQMSGSFYMKTGNKTKIYSIEQGKIYKNGFEKGRGMEIRNTVVEQYMMLQLIKGRTNLLLDQLALALKRNDLGQVELYKTQLSKLQQERSKHKLLDD